jgi:type I restriction enzyme, R subunit
MNEAETRAELIDPMLRECGWGVVEDSRILREYHITAGKIQAGGRAKPVIADYVLVYKNIKLAVIEAKSNELEVGEGVAQAKEYALKLKLDYTYASNGREIYEMCLKNGTEGVVAQFSTPDELWNRVFSDQNEWRDKFTSVPFEDLGGTKRPRFYQEIAVNKTVEAIANNKDRLLLTLATGTGKTFIAFQIAWKLFQTRWNIQRDGSRRPRILFLADRNILASQAFNDFSAFPEDALVRINPKSIAKKGKVPTNGNIFFTIFQTFMSGKDNKPNFGEYPPDYFDLIIIDECHRGGANDEGNWRGILEYFHPAVQLGLTATPKRVHNADTYKYFGDPLYVYSLKEGINDGFLTPFKVKRIKTTIDDYIYTSDDDVLEGEVESGKLYTESDFNKIIQIKEREAYRVKTFLKEVNQKEKSIVFCASQDHALIVRDLINQYSDSKDPLYCVRVTANDGALGELYLKQFQDNEKFIPTMLTTSKKLSTGVDARNVRNIVLMRPVQQMIEFKQIIGRGTRLYEGKEFFTIYDFVDAYLNFNDPEWDGDPVEPDPPNPKPPKPTGGTGPGNPEDPDDPEDPEDPDDPPGDPKKMIKIKLRDGKERELQHTVATSFWSADGKPISIEEFLENLYGALPDFFKSEEELREIWSNPLTRKAFLEKLADAGFGKDELSTLQNLINAEKSDLIDVLAYVTYAIQPISREERVEKAKPLIFMDLTEKEKEFLEFVLSQYIETGVEELDQEKLPRLLELKYQSIADAVLALGGVQNIQQRFISFQKSLYKKQVS